MATNPISLDFVQGDTVNISIIWTDDLDVPQDLTGATITSSIRKEYKTNVLKNFNIIDDDLSIGQFTLNMAAADTAELPIWRNKQVTSFVWDVNVMFSGGNTMTPIYGYLKMQSEVTG